MPHDRILTARFRFAAVMLALVALGASTARPVDAQTQAPAGQEMRFADQIKTFLDQDRTAAPPQGAILFIGSSIFRQWTNVKEHMAPLPVFNLYNEQWPVYTAGRTVAPAKIVSELGNPGAVVDSILSNGVIVSGGTVRRSVLSPGVHVEGDATVEESILLDGVRIGAGAVIQKAIIDKNVTVPSKSRIGVDDERDVARFHVSSGGVVAIGKEDLITQPR